VVAVVDSDEVLGGVGGEADVTGAQRTESAPGVGHQNLAEVQKTSEDTRTNLDEGVPLRRVPHGKQEGVSERG
jgi:hypothetical protein